ncbi:MAG: tetratricopeptide repeat protein [Sphingomicrobium sp.]
MRLRLLLLATLIAAAPVSGALARDPVTPEQRIDRLERQVRQVQRSLFPKGQPADTAGFVDTPAATQEAVGTLSSRLDAIERQMTDLIRTGEENTQRLGVMEADLARLRADNEARFKTIEGGAGPATEPAAPTVGPDPAPAPVEALPPKSVPRPRAKPPAAVRVPAKVPTAAPATPPAATDFTAAGEAAYQAGFDLWTAKKYDQAITQLRAMASSFPGHRRVSWANNLAGRALLDKGQPRAAAEALLANYRGDPKGERAPDSLFYLGQSLIKLGQASQACKAYAELADVYGDTIRAPLKAMIDPARAQAQCK